MKRLGAATEAWRVAVPHKGADDPTEMAGSLVYRTPKGILMRVKREGQKKSEKISENPLTSVTSHAIIGVQVEARRSPKRVRPTRVRKTKPMKPPQAERGMLCGI